MKVYEIATPGNIDALALSERPRPTPGHGQVLMRVRACSLNYRDLAVVRGTYRAGSSCRWSRSRTAPAKSSRLAPA